MTTVANLTAQPLSESGQSLLEFLLLIPLVMGFALIAIKANTLVQASIVNQQYARLQTHFLAFNSAWYPDNKFQVANIMKNGMGQFPMGISENPFDADDENYDGTRPQAPIVNIARTPAAEVHGTDEAATEPDARVKVRVRTSVSICTHPLLLAGGTKILDIAVDSNWGGRPKSGELYKLSENSRYEFCAGGKSME